MAKLAISLFGGFQARLDEAVLSAFESDKVRALLGYLAVETGLAPLDRGHDHSRQHLADLFWPEQLEGKARRSLNQALYNLRNVLRERSQESAPYLLVTPETIQFNPASDHWLDVSEFTRHLEACDRHEHRLLETCQPCQERLQQATSLYQGDFLEGFSIRDSAAFDEWLLVCRERYRLYARRALAGLAGYYERQGRTQDALQVARRLAGLEPYDDETCRRLMRLLAACGKSGEALAVYERFRETLRAELNLDPQAGTRLLYASIRQQKGKGAGVVSRQHNLPASLSPLIGREIELAEVQSCLLDLPGPRTSGGCRLLTILGPGGSGKSRLALEAARGLLDQFAHGIYLVSLSPIALLESLLPSLAAVLGLQIKEQKAPLAQVQDYLRRKEVLLVFDSCETLLEGVPLLLELLHAAPGLKILATSRVRLNVEEEQVYLLSGLSYPSFENMDQADRSAAVRLFASAARRARPGFELEPRTLPDVARICAEVHGMPLAILLAAAWVEVFSPAQILAEMRLSLDFLQSDWADLPPRQRGIRLSFDYSWNLLDEREREVFQALCVFRGGFTRQAAEFVSQANLAELRRLADKSLLAPQTGDWYAIHELLRQYGLEKLNADPHRSAWVHHRYSAYYLEKLMDWEAGLKGARQLETLVALDAKTNDLRSAWDLACQHADIDRLVHAMEGMCLFYELRMRLKEGQSLCQSTLSALSGSASPQAPLLLVSALAWHARFSRLLGEHAQASRSLEQSQALLDGPAGADLDLRSVQAMVFLESAEAIFTADLAAARHFLESSLSLYRTYGDDWRRAGVLCRLAVNLGFVGDFSGSDTLLGEAIEIYQSLGYVPGVANTRRIIAQNHVRLGKLISGLALMRQVIADSQAAGNRAQAALEQRTLGVVLVWNGRFAEAQPLLLDSLAVAEHLGDLYEMTFDGLLLGGIGLFTGQYGSARPRFARSLELARANGFQREAAFCLWAQGGIELAQSSPQTARPYYLESIKLYRQVGHRDELGWALALDAFCLLQLSEVDEAIKNLSEVIEIALSIRSYLSALLALVVCAVWHAMLGKAELSLELYSLVYAQPIFANSTWFADVFGKSIAAYTSQLDPVTAEAARQRCRQHQLFDTLAEMQVWLSAG